MIRMMNDEDDEGDANDGHVKKVHCLSEHYLFRNALSRTNSNGVFNSHSKYQDYDA